MRAIAPWMRPSPRSANFRIACWKSGRRALGVLEETGEPGLVLAGRGYNIYDRGINCDIPRKLRDRYGANVIPLDFLVTGREPMSGLHENMYWASGRKILQAAHVAASRANLHVIYLTNFKCGPGLIHQALRARSGRRPFAGAAIRRAWQRRGIYDALRSLSR